MLKDYSMQLKKNIAVLLHLMFLTLAVAGISVMYLNTQIGSGISWLKDRRYEESDQFQAQFQQDLDNIFDYVSYRDVFETDGSLDLSREMFSITRDGPEIIYTLEEVLRYAKSQGFYLNDRFEVVNDMFLYDNAATSTDCLVNWRAYSTDQKLTEPGDAYTSLLELSKEVLHCLSCYYKVHYELLSNPSNLYFQISYENDWDDPLLYTNCADKPLDDLWNLGRYCYLDSESIFIDTNLSDIPRNITVSMEKNNFYNASEYYVMVAVDTNYPADDAYAAAAADYQRIRSHFQEGLIALALGILGCLSTLCYLISMSGYQTADRSTVSLHNFDTISTEVWILLIAVCAMFLLFLGEKIGYRLIHLLITVSSWEYTERMLRAVIIYICCLVGFFSLLRRYKARVLWENSLIHRLKVNIDDYFSHRTFSLRLFFMYSAFLGVQLCCFVLIGITLYFLRYPQAKAALAATVIALIVIDYFTYHHLYSSSRQEDRIADAIGRIAGGDTSYQMDVEGLSGKELCIARQINRIGIGLERALQEQVKSERLKADLITNVSHDIKTPLTSIINYVDLLKREHIQNDRVQEYLSVLDQKSQRLKTLTEDLVEASKASSGNLKLEITRLDLVEMIWQTNGEFEEKFAERHLDLVSNLPESGIIIEADGRHLWRVLENLYNNAFKYAMEHSRVYTDISCENDQVYFTIKNVSEHPLNVSSDELTERFVRGDVSRTTEGSGLGLSIAQSLTKLQNGTFEIIIDGDLFKIRIGFPIVKP